MNYKFLDSGDGKKLEQFGAVRMIRPAAAALWRPALSSESWKEADVIFSREGGNRWSDPRRDLPRSWETELGGLRMKTLLTDFGHVGVFPEHVVIWDKLRSLKAKKVLNLFAYTGGATLAAAAAGSAVCHVDAAKKSVDWARENAERNGLEKAPIRWIVDDAQKFLAREARRGISYDAILLDPPSFGRGPKGEVFKIEEEINLLLASCFALKPQWLLLSSHTTTMTPTVLCNLLSQMAPGEVEAEELLLGEEMPLPAGCFALWTGK